MTLSEALVGSSAKVRRQVAYWGVTMVLYALCLTLLWAEVGIDMAPAWQARGITLYSAFGAVLFYPLIRASERLGLSAAALAFAQAAYALLAVVAAYAVVGPLRGATLSLLLVVLMFCSFALSPRAANALSTGVIFLLGLVMLCMAQFKPHIYQPVQEAVHFVLAASLLCAVSFLTGQSNYLRTRLTRQKRELADALARIQLLATRDELTALPNRLHMREMLNHESNRHRREGQTLCLAILDIDLFKRVNDTYGHPAGDAVLRKFAERALSVLRVTDVLARWGGEEFFLLMPNTGIQAGMLVLERMRTRVAEMDLSEIDPALRVTFSAGLTALAQGEEVADAIQRADKALYQAKASGRNAVRMFDADMESALALRAKLESELYEGLRNKQFALFYQPQVDANNRVTGAEALVRWQHPRRGFVGPVEFIPLAEEMGLIVPLGNWVLETACRQLKAWETKPATAQLCLSVNVSARQLRHPEFLKHVQTVLAESAINPRRLRLELTESVLVADIEDTIGKMNKLRATGVSFALDDFGTGYSSLSYLKRLPIDELKIDQSFVRDILTDQNNAAIASTIIGLAQSLGLDVIAEGVETEAQRNHLLRNGCGNFQGYLISEPLLPEQFEKFLSSNILCPTIPPLPYIVAR
jgi:diguanylate cyclase (GGDEF)-like protein